MISTHPAELSSFVDSPYLAYLRIAVKSARAGTYAEVGGLGGLCFGALKGMRETFRDYTWGAEDIETLDELHALKRVTIRASAALGRAEYKSGVTLVPDKLEDSLNQRQVEFVLDWVISAALIASTSESMPTGNSVAFEPQARIEAVVEAHNVRVDRWRKTAEGWSFIRPLLLLMENHRLIQPEMKRVGLDEDEKSRALLVLYNFALQGINV